MELSGNTDPTIPTVSVEVWQEELDTRAAAARYGMENNYSTFHNRLTKLNLKPYRRGRKSYLNASQIELLDRLHSHLKSGGTFSEFNEEDGEAKPITQSKPSTKSTEIVQTSQSSITSTRSIEDIEIIATLQTLAKANYDVLTPQKRLLEAAENNFVITSEQLGSILGISPRTVSSWKTGTKKLGFLLHKDHEGSSVVWKVERCS